MKITDEVLYLDNDAPFLRNYCVKFTAIIKGSMYCAAKSKEEAAQLFREDATKSFDKIDEFKNYKINQVEEVK